jgi:hypothetical protein
MRRDARRMEGMSMKFEHWLRIAGCTLTLSLAATVPLSAQFAQYTPPGGGTDQPELRREAFAQAIESARWRLGPVRVEPWFGVRDFGFVDEPEVAGAEDEGFRALGTAGAGLRFYVPVGNKIVLAAHALPEYSWAEQDERSRLNGRYGVGAFFFWNRLTLQLSAGRTEELGILTSELLERNNQRRDELAAAAELEALGSLFLFAEVAERDYESLADPLDDPTGATLGRLDRRETLARSGVRWRSPRGWRFGLGLESSQVDFADGALDRSNAGEAPILEVVSPEGGVDASLQLAYRSLDPEPGSSFVAFDGVTGSFRAGLGKGYRVTPSVHASRNLVYSLDGAGSYIESDRAGLSVSSRLTSRGQVSVFFEQGTDRYQGTTAVTLREEDQRAWGASVQWTLGRRLSIAAGYSSESYEPTGGGPERTLEVARIGLTLAGDQGTWY